LIIFLSVFFFEKKLICSFFHLVIHGIRVFNFNKMLSFCTKPSCAMFSLQTMHTHFFNLFKSLVLLCVQSSNTCFQWLSLSLILQMQLHWQCKSCVKINNKIITSTHIWNIYIYINPFEQIASIFKLPYSYI